LGEAGKKNQCSKGELYRFADSEVSAEVLPGHGSILFWELLRILADVNEKCQSMPLMIPRSQTQIRRLRFQL
jgi:hypothetical protein